MRTTTLKKGDKVALLIDDEQWAEARVIDPLSTQFTCRVLRQKQVRFYFYLDKGFTWRPLK